jgi:hypothetical protein
VIKKTTVGGDGSFTFETNYSTPFTLAGGEQHSSNESVGNKMVTEVAVTGWTQTSATCVSSKGDEEFPGNMSLQAGETITCTFVNTKDTAPEEHHDEGSGGGSGGGSGDVPPPAAPVSGGGPIGNGPVGNAFGGGSVLGASTGNGQVLGESCGIYMGSHLRRGVKNSSEQVKKLQQFLNKELGLTLPVTGFFGPATEDAVKKFQSKYADDTLKPWGIKTPTGLVYLSTVRAINKLSCPDLTLDLPPLVDWSKNHKN